MLISHQQEVHETYDPENSESESELEPGADTYSDVWSICVTIRSLMGLDGEGHYDLHILAQPRSAEHMYSTRLMRLVRIARIRIRRCGPTWMHCCI